MIWSYALGLTSSAVAGICVGILLSTQRLKMLRSDSQKEMTHYFSSLSPERHDKDALSSVYSAFPKLAGFDYLVLPRPRELPIVLRLNRKSEHPMVVMAQDGTSYIQWEVSTFGDANKHAFLVTGVPSAGILPPEGTLP